jgi:phosphatidylcholine synthase
MKTANNYFRGFPTLWNVVAFYLIVLKPAPWLAVGLVALLAVLTFVPFKFLHPFRVVRLRIVSMAAVVVWALLAADALVRSLEPGPFVAGGLVVLAVYFLGVGSPRSVDRAAFFGRSECAGHPRRTRNSTDLPA